ncbi:NRAMP (natural resistance-associated macrophage protein) metal ion transporters [Flavobacterium glycines]|uniref:Iron transporter n=1 Tax=Flavobacterium glycines TaxID=551990 RepID=A0A1B9DGD0_9FLAO|nr:divalent metal cation transporter [Flavobacterium glycines]OCB68766.1 iron transporter [Flavobacterium glycines]GEL10942.1 iron transporter [Flavobacterium glycines]SDJ35481.1 NRAMP (natural resistance-associated macrophage protein) metal ion transporters [Flavobacterium glycines]
MKNKKSFSSKLFSSWKRLGPGLVTGASDDDPSGIATYSQAGAAFGLSTLWTAIIAFPLMASIQQMCARIGLVTSHGLTGTLKQHYPRPILYLTLLFSFPAIVMNIGADIAGMGAVGNLLFPSIDANYFSVVFTIILLILIVYLPYQKIASVLKYLCIVMLVYFIVPFLYKQDFGEIIKATFIPTIKFDKDFIAILVGILGTTISPYLFFWQVSVEVEEMRHKRRHLIVDKKLIHDMDQDVDFGMTVSGFVMYFIILTTGTVLFKGGIHQIDTVEQAALALKPLAGNLSYLLFAIGVIGTGLIAIPVLSGAISYIITETFGWKEGLDKKFHEAKAFYIIIAISLVLGLSLNYVGITPIQSLIYTAILYGLTAPVLIAIILHISNNKKIMGENVNGRITNILGFTALIIMTVTAVALIYMQFSNQ